MDLFRNPSLPKSNRFETVMWASKLVLMSMGIISTVVLLKVAVIPFTFDLVVSTFPRLWVSARSWLSPAFVYIIVNFIIITIAASSNFHHKNRLSSNTPPTNDSKFSSFTPTATVTDHAISGTGIHLSEHRTQSNELQKQEKEDLGEEEEEKEIAEVKDSGLSCNKPAVDPLPVKCTNDSFPPDPSPEISANDYISPDSDDTMDATWRAIMEGQGKSMTPHLKKSDTWGARITKAEPFRGIEDGDDDPAAWAKKELRKSDTFNDAASLKREKSMGQDELNRRADEFIKKINLKMKLERLESEQRFREMVNRGV